jgi:hypothetical protein
MSLKSGQKVDSVKVLTDGIPEKLLNYVVKNVPSVGISSKDLDVDNQLSLL